MKITAANLPHLIAAAAILAAIAAPAIAATSPRDADALAKATYIYIATVRKDGNQSKAAPVWFITTADNQVLIETSPTSWKARRIKRGSPAMIWIGTRTGPAFIGKAEIVTDTAAAGPGDRRVPQEISARLDRLCASVSSQVGSRPNRRDPYLADARFARRFSVCARHSSASARREGKACQRRIERVLKLARY